MPTALRPVASLGQAVRDQLGADAGDVVVLGLPRGGVSVAAPVARALDAPLDVLVVRKIGVPGQPELAMGALARDSVVRNTDVIAALRISDAAFDAAAAAERAVAEARERDYRGVHAHEALSGRVAVVTDDGLATGATARAAVQALTQSPDDRPARVVLAVPVAPADTLADSGPSWTRSSAWPRLRPSTPSALGIATSPRSAMQRCVVFYGAVRSGSPRRGPSTG